MKPHVPSTAELFAHVYAHPLDQAPRHVLADRLLEEGDPRGEFIALQLKRAKGSLPPSGVKRERRLLAEHEASWLAPIARVLIGHTTEWEGGFLSACGARLDGSTVGAPEWATVKRLTLYSSERERPGELAADLKSLQQLERANALALDVLVKAARKPPLEALGYLGPARQGREWVARQTAALLELADLPRLKRLKLAPPNATELNGRDFAFFFESRLAKRLEELAFALVRPAYRVQLVEMRDRPQPPLDLASFVQPATELSSLRTLEVESVGLVSYRLTRAEDGLTRLSIRPHTSPASTGNLLPQMVEALRGLEPRSLGAIALVNGRRLARRHLFSVEQAARRFPRVKGVEYLSS